MNQRIDLNRKVYDKDKYQKTIDTSFTELLPPPPPEVEIVTLTVDQFFQLYNQLFFSIPKTGINSHNTLIQQSSEYVGDEQTNEELEALVQEVNYLRAELLEAQQELIRIQTEQAQLSLDSING
jgi:hypothetical protein